MSLKIWLVERPEEYPTDWDQVDSFVIVSESAKKASLYSPDCSQIWASSPRDLPHMPKQEHINMLLDERDKGLHRVRQWSEDEFPIGWWDAYETFCCYPYQTWPPADKLIVTLVGTSEPSYEEGTFIIISSLNG